MCCLLRSVSPPLLRCLPYVTSFVTQHTMRIPDNVPHHSHPCRFGVLQRYSLFAHKKISTSCSSVGEIRLKENCEALMDKLEKDINRLSIPAPIYISDS